MGSTPALQPTWQGHIASTKDALILFEACLTGELSHVARRPHDRERAHLIRSGNVFIYEEHSSGIKRWTDGIAWSPSRILGNCLVYRELDHPFPPGEKKRAKKKDKRSPIRKSSEPYGRRNGSGNGYSISANSPSYDIGNGTISKETERSLVGSLTDSYFFKEPGLVKKTISVTLNGVTHHLVSYYTCEDALSGRLPKPTEDPVLKLIEARPDLVTKQNFRTPIDEAPVLDPADDRKSICITNNTFGYGQPRPTFGMSGGGSSISLPTPPQVGIYTPSSNVPTSNYFSNNYSMAGMNHTQYGDGLPSVTSANSGYSHYGGSPGMFPGHKADTFDVASYNPGKQRYSSISGISDNGLRSQMPPSDVSFSRRPSNYSQASDSGFSHGPMDNKIAVDHGYPTGYYGDLPGRASVTHPYSTAQRALPPPGHQDMYQRPGSHSYQPESAAIKDTMGWQTGNVSAGHGHYMDSHNQPQQWATPGSS